MKPAAVVIFISLIAAIVAIPVACVAPAVVTRTCPDVPDAGIVRAAPMAPANVTVDWPFKCSALKVYAVLSDRDIRGYYMPVRCVPELAAYPGSVLADAGCVPGCVTAGLQVCWSGNGCELKVTP